MKQGCIHQAGIQAMANNIDTFEANIGLMINCEKTKAMKIGSEQHPPILIIRAAERGIRREVTISWKLRIKRLRLRAGSMRQDRKTASISQRLGPVGSSNTTVIHKVI